MATSNPSSFDDAASIMALLAAQTMTQARNCHGLKAGAPSANLPLPTSTNPLNAFMSRNMVPAAVMRAKRRKG